MRNQITVREFIRNYENGKYDKNDRATMIEAGWYDWFCEDYELKSRLYDMFPKIKQLANSPKIDIDNMYVFFKNNCPGLGELYDDFRFCGMKDGDVVYTVTPASGHEREFGVADVWGKENCFNGELVKGDWHDIEDFFQVGRAA